MLLLAIAVLAATQLESVDFADVARRGDWLCHPVYGDASFDAFQRGPANPIRRGASPFEWPVNGFLFEDPPSGHWYIYVGLYPEGYAFGEGKRMECTVYRSTDTGASWQELGPVFPQEEAFCFENTSLVAYAPDVSVVYEDGRYHMLYDFATADSSWSSIHGPTAPADNGIGYAWSDRPEGPFIRTTRPVYSTRAHPVYRGKYRRAYAQTLIRREHDWLALAMMDSAAHYSWALVGMTAPQAEGPYSEPVFLRCVDDAYFHPPLMEFYPAFVHDGWIYAPATAVARNRNFQGVFRVPIEASMSAEAWQLYQYGSVWHAEDIEHEHFGIWGQTFSGFVDKGGELNAMFPSRDGHGFGTINMASRPWNTPYRDHGFVMSAHGAPSLALVKRRYGAFRLELRAQWRGTVAVVWAYQAPLGPNAPAADSMLHPLSLTRHNAVELTPGAWRLIHVAESTPGRVVAEGTCAADTRVALVIEQADDGLVSLTVNGGEARTATLERQEGPIGLLCSPDSRIEVDALTITGESYPPSFDLLYLEAILGAGAAQGQWKAAENPLFKWGLGAESLGTASRGKWNFVGQGFTLWAPKGPEYRTAALFVDGERVARVDLHASEATPSAAVHHAEGLAGAFHAVVVEAETGPIPLDTLTVFP
ncbi:MAG TPA: hypothetical protein PLO37_08760 [Candidatus Hydrogenedentes bacterium]|nr:hypothetical protein [Candidatus Hydrogenedentota bacterium]HPG66924.1 hypothetical protein [Candidatus Hydrogenedentota bacterium]